MSPKFDFLKKLLSTSSSTISAVVKYLVGILLHMFTQIALCSVNFSVTGSPYIISDDKQPLYYFHSYLLLLSSSCRSRYRYIMYSL